MQVCPHERERDDFLNIFLVIKPPPRLSPVLPKRLNPNAKRNLWLGARSAWAVSFPSKIANSICESTQSTAIFVSKLNRLNTSRPIYM